MKMQMDSCARSGPERNSTSFVDMEPAPCTTVIVRAMLASDVPVWYWERTLLCVGMVEQVCRQPVMLWFTVNDATGRIHARYCLAGDEPQ